MGTARRKKDEDLTSAMEDYLETIYVLTREDSGARVKDISELMDVRKSSVNSAVNILKDRGFVRHERYGRVALTPNGENVSEGIKKKHDLLVRFLGDILGIDKGIAIKDACRIEHVISPETDRRLRRFIEFVDSCSPGEKPEWVEGLERYIKKREGT
jgi:DtxR family Mn-dependent transcriptional regulator